RVRSLREGALGLESGLTVEGLGAGLLTVSGNIVSRVFDVAEAKATISTVTIRGLTIAGGKSVLGGGIFNREILTVEDCTLRGNSADQVGGGIFTSGRFLDHEATLTVRNCTL